MKRSLTFIITSLSLLGCSPSEDPSPEILASLIIPSSFVDTQKRMMEAEDIPEEQQKRTLEVTKVSNTVSREVLARFLEQRFSPNELRELQKIYESGSMKKLQEIRYSYDYTVEFGELANKRLNEGNTEPNDADNPVNSPENPKNQSDD